MNDPPSRASAASGARPAPSRSGYQENFTAEAGEASQMYRAQVRTGKAQKIVAVLQHHLGDPSRLRLLDLSCSTGFMANVFARHFAEVVGIDIDAGAVAHAEAHRERDNVSFLTRDALHTGFAPASFDVAICNHMYEHVPDAAQLFREIWRVLRPNGVCYFGGNNRLRVVEPHYGPMPFLSWLPRPLAHRYMRLMKKGDHYYETHFTYWTLRRMLEDFDIVDYTLRVLEQPAAFAALDVVTPGSWGQRLGLLAGRHLYWALPGYIWLLVKRPRGS